MTESANTPQTEVRIHEVSVKDDDTLQVSLVRIIKFSDIPHKTQQFLLELRASEIEEMRDAMELVKMVRSTARVVRWVVYGLIATLVSFGMGLDALKKILLWWKGGP